MDEDDDEIMLQQLQKITVISKYFSFFFIIIGVTVGEYISVLETLNSL